MRAGDGEASRVVLDGFELRTDVMSSDTPIATRTRAGGDVGPGDAADRGPRERQAEGGSVMGGEGLRSSRSYKRGEWKVGWDARREAYASGKGGR